MRVQLMTIVAAVAVTGCASSGAPTLANRFVRQGTPALDLGGPRPGELRKVAPPPPRLVDAADLTRRTSARGGSLLESVNPDIRQALAALVVDPSPSHHVRAARAYRRLGIFDQAHDYLTRSLDLHGPDAAVYDERARLWRDWGHPALGVPDSHRAIHLQPQAAALHNTLGTLLYRIGQRQAAADRFRQAAALDPTAWYALANLCHVNLALGRTREAIAQCRQATELRRKHPGPAAPREEGRP